MFSLFHEKTIALLTNMGIAKIKKFKAVRLEQLTKRIDLKSCGFVLNFKISSFVFLSL